MVALRVAQLRRPSRARKTESYFSPARPRVFAHRGLALDAPENTLLAFAKAIAVGVDYVETDVHASADGHSVIAHDADLKRIANRSVRVDQLTLAELRRIDLGFGQTFATLAEALDGFPDTRFNIDVKSAAAVAPTVAAVLAAAATNRVLVTSFDEGRRAATVRGLPGVASSASARLFLPALVAGTLGFSPLVRHALRNVMAVQVPERALGLRVTSKRILRQLHDAGLEVHVWTVNDPTRMTELLDLGVDGIVTDRADVALEVLRGRS